MYSRGRRPGGGATGRLRTSRVTEVRSASMGPLPTGVWYSGAACGKVPWSQRRRRGVTAFTGICVSSTVAQKIRP